MNRALWNKYAAWDGKTRFYGVLAEDLLLRSRPSAPVVSITPYWNAGISPPIDTPTHYSTPMELFLRQFNPEKKMDFGFDPSELLGSLRDPRELKEIIAHSDDLELKERAKKTLMVCDTAEKMRDLLGRLVDPPRLRWD